MEETLEEGLSRIFGTGSESTEIAPNQQSASGSARANTSPETTNGDRAQQIRDAYERATEAQKNGDWATYGEEITKLGELIKELQ
jgi:uncharacterized protein